MAGESSRFFNQGYELPKYKLMYKGKTILENILIGFSAYFKIDTFLFGINPNFNDSIFVKSICKKLGIEKFIIIELKSVTLGQADTVNILLNYFEFSLYWRIASTSSNGIFFSFFCFFFTSE